MTTSKFYDFTWICDTPKKLARKMDTVIRVAAGENPETVGKEVATRMGGENNRDFKFEELHA